MKLVETIHGRRSKWTIFRDDGWFSTTFYVRRDGESVYSCSTLDHAVSWIRRRD
jgi:hypothetical protein